MEVKYRNQAGTPHHGTPHSETPRNGHHEGGSHHHHHQFNQVVLKKLRRRMITDDPLHSGLHKLKIHGKDLGSLPEEVFLLDDLEVLDLSPERESCLYYQLANVPSAIGRLVNLKILIVDTNELEELPSEIGLLSSLERLCISNNHLSYLPESFKSLKRLKSLHAANNKLKTFPVGLCELSLLEFLDLSDNRIQQIPTQIGNLHNLLNLLVVFNQLETLPDSICDLRELRVLWIGHNQITRLPRKFGQLRNLDWGYRHTSSSVIDGNPMVSPPIDVCKRGIDAIAKYFAVTQNGTSRRDEPLQKPKAHVRQGDRRDQQPHRGDHDDHSGSVSLASLADGYEDTSRTNSQNDHPRSRDDHHRSDRKPRENGDRSHRTDQHSPDRYNRDQGQRYDDHNGRGGEQDRSPDEGKPRASKSRVRAQPSNRRDTGAADVPPLKGTSPSRRH